MTLFAGRRGDQCIIFREQGSTDPPGGPRIYNGYHHLYIFLNIAFLKLQFCPERGPQIESLEMFSSLTENYRSVHWNPLLKAKIFRL